MRIARSAARVTAVAAVAAALTGFGPAVSGACACGAFVANDKLRAQQETALIELSGGTEAITLSVQASSEADRAAFLMPVPARAEFAIADGEIFTELDRLTRPAVEVRTVEIDGDGAGGAAPGNGATVVDHVEVGPYEVAQLAGDDATAVTEWLQGNDFTLPDELGTALDPYLAEGWLVVAVKLAPTSGSLADGLPPMRLSFQTDAPVYPMRLSATADFTQPLRLYVLADHRVDITSPAPSGADPDLTFAGPVSADPAYPKLSAALTGPRYLTRYDGQFEPQQITDDIRITTAATDEPFRATVVVTEYVRSTGLLTPLLVVGGSLVVGAGLVVAFRRRARGSTPDGSGGVDTLPR